MHSSARVWLKRQSMVLVAIHKWRTSEIMNSIICQITWHVVVVSSDGISVSGDAILVTGDVISVSDYDAIAAWSLSSVHHRKRCCPTTYIRFNSVHSVSVCWQRNAVAFSENIWIALVFVARKSIFKSMGGCWKSESYLWCRIFFRYVDMMSSRYVSCGLYYNIYSYCCMWWLMELLWILYWRYGGYWRCYRIVVAIEDVV